MSCIFHSSGLPFRCSRGAAPELGKRDTATAPIRQSNELNGAADEAKSNQFFIIQRDAAAVAFGGDFSASEKRKIAAVFLHFCAGDRI